MPLKQAIKIVRPLNFKTKTEYQNWWTETRPENLANVYNPKVKEQKRLKRT